MKNADSIAEFISKQLPKSKFFSQIFATEGVRNKSGYPVISKEAFGLFRDNIPHLFTDGDAILTQFANLRKSAIALTESSQIIIETLTSMIKTAGITAPSDLWIMREILSSHKKIGILEALAAEPAGIERSRLSKRFQLDSAFLQHDICFLTARSVYRCEGSKILLQTLPQIKQLVTKVTPLPKELSRNWVERLADYMTKGTGAKEDIDAFLHIPSGDSSDRVGWPATHEEMEISFRLVPTVLALRINNVTAHLRHGISLLQYVPHVTPELLKVLQRAGVIYAKDSMVSELGERVFARGPGPFGIIHAYHSYMQNHERLLRGGENKPHVARGANVAASQDANAKTFKLANDSLDEFCKDTGFTYKVFIEHAVGQGEATRQRYSRSKGNNVQYFGADLEKSAIEKTRQQKSQSELPTNMVFMSGLDIGKPGSLVEVITGEGFDVRGGVMMVGNGFHEVRSQTNDRMVEVFRGYCDAGLVLIFTEESGLSDEDLLATAWNTYHSGFRYVHAISGQGLRPARDTGGGPNERYSWAKCAELAGYVLLQKYMTRTRTIYPFSKDGYNPAISVNYFCVPKYLIDELKLPNDPA